MGFEMISALFGVIIGGLITYFVERALQDREFKRQEKDRKEIQKCYLDALKKEIEDEYKRLRDLKSNIYAGFPREYFDLSIKDTIMAELIKTPLFLSYGSTLKKVTVLIKHLSVLNAEIELIHNIIAGKVGSTQDQEYKLRQARDHAGSTITDIFVVLGETNNQLNVINELDKIIEDMGIQ